MWKPPRMTDITEKSTSTTSLQEFHDFPRSQVLHLRLLHLLTSILKHSSLPQNSIRSSSHHLPSLAPSNRPRSRSGPSWPATSPRPRRRPRRAWAPWRWSPRCDPAWHGRREAWGVGGDFGRAPGRKIASLTLRVIGPDHFWRVLTLQFAGVWTLKTFTFEGPWFLGGKKQVPFVVGVGKCRVTDRKSGSVRTTQNRWCGDSFRCSVHFLRCTRESGPS